MKKIMTHVIAAMMMVFSFAAAVRAEDAKPAPNPLADIKAALGLSIYIQGGYTYNFKNPDPRENELRVFDHKANSIGLDLAQIVFVKDAPMGGAGYKLKLSAGETAKWIHSAGLGSAGDEFDVTEAYISYMAPLGKGLKLDFGKMATYHGAEVIEARDNVNYSRSLLFNYAIPFTHTGLKLSYVFSDALNAAVHVVNGWDNTEDNNSGKTVGLSVGYVPMEQLSMFFNLMYGPEMTDNSSNNRFLFDWVGTIKPAKNLSFILNVDYATEEKGAGTEDSKWYGVAGIAKYDLDDRYSLSGRLEYFNDKDGVRTGTIQKLYEVTLTPEIRLAPGLIIRPEYRHDWSDSPVFKGGSRKSQDTIALGVMYTW
ncbi:MAG: porin [Thermodesulfovibrionales bacterium]